MPLWVVVLTVCAADFKLIPRLVARTCGVSWRPENAERTVEMFAYNVSHSIASSCTMDICYSDNRGPSKLELGKVLETGHNCLGGGAPMRSPVSNTALAKASSCFAMKVSCGS
jgi:hypothetical protein